MISNADLVNAALGVVLPWLTGLVTRQDAHPKIKGAVLFVLSAISAVLTALSAALATGQGFDWRATIVGALLTFGLGVVMHTGLYRHIDAYQAVGATGGFIGTPAPITAASK